MPAGRPVKGPQLVQDLEGSDQAKRRMKVILETLAGQRTVMEACLELGIGKSAFHELRKRVLQAALADVEPRPAGRPPTAEPPEAPEVEQLKSENERLRSDLEVAHVREEILLAMPEVFDPARKAGEKGGPSARPRKDRGGKRGRRASRSSRPRIWRWWCGSSRSAARSFAGAVGEGPLRTGSDGRSSGR